jgi:hypothetical protein
VDSHAPAGEAPGPDLLFFERLAAMVENCLDRKQTVVFSEALAPVSPDPGLP